MSQWVCGQLNRKNVIEITGNYFIFEKHYSKDNGESCEPTELTTRELEIVKLIIEGLSTKEIADQLCLSHHTIYTHKKNVMKKLGIKSTSELILYAVNTGLTKTK